MWPGQQPPGGEQNPQDQNPYQQPGYQQPNPYQQPGYPQQPPQQPQPGYAQPGYQQPNPYQQPAAPQYPAPGMPPAAPVPAGSPDRKRTTAIAIVAATAVVVAAGVTGFLVLKDDGEKPSTAGGDAKPSQSAPPAPASSSPLDNPRDGSDAPKPTVAGWKVVANPKHGTLFDVPAEWEVSGPGVGAGFEDQKKGDGSAYIMMSAPAYLRSAWCAQDTDKDGRQEEKSLASTGSRGGQGAKDTASNARAEAGEWVYAAYAQHVPDAKLKQHIKVSPAKPYTSASGLTGHIATATATGAPKPYKCSTDGKSIAFSFKNKKGDFATWVLFGADGVKDELPDATIQKILSTVRLDESVS
ncbi:hypothetical protein ACIRD2_05405 [Streptomyces sp. NPDC093595]|uniref:hypothetical protein n=1 Tax=Streptomyces sp. NPDC093595 TaxID=3366045 RepID=UPI0037FC4C4D